jgi:hypothetical protein
MRRRSSIRTSNLARRIGNSRGKTRPNAIDKSLPLLAQA